MTGIAREVLPAKSDRALNKFLTEYDWDEQQLNHERLEELQRHGETRWSQNSYLILDDTITQKARDEVPGVGRFYDHTKRDTVWGKTSSTPSMPITKPPNPLTFRLSEDNKHDESKYDLARESLPNSKKR